MDEVNADREDHGKKPFDDDPPKPAGKSGIIPAKRSRPDGKRYYNEIRKETYIQWR